MSKITFIAGGVTTAVNTVNLCFAEASRLGLFDNWVLSTFTVVFIIGITLCGGMCALLIRIWVKQFMDKHFYNKTKSYG